jgi:hypothetical protein
MNTRSILISVFVFLNVSLVQANIVSLNPRPRLLGMGGAGLAGMGDFDSAMVNPAGLADNKTWHLEAFPLLVEVPLDLGMISSFQDYQDTTDRAGATTAEKKAAYKTFLNDVAREALGTRVNIYPNFTKGGFHIGVLADFTVNPRLRAGGLASNQVVELGGSSGTAGVIAAYGKNFLQDQLQVGITAKPIYRVALTPNQTQTLYDVVKGMNSGANIGDEIFGVNKGDARAFALGVDLGAKYYIPYLPLLKPSIGFTYQDIGDTRFFTGDSQPEDIPQSISMGVAVHPSWKFVTTTFAFDFRDLNRQIDTLNKLHFGFETRFGKLIAFRAGLAQMYWTVGANLNLWVLDLDLYVAAQEAGRYAHIQEQRSLGFKISFGI